MSDYKNICDEKLIFSQNNLRPWGGNNVASHSVSFFYLNMYSAISDFLSRNSVDKSLLVDTSSGGGLLTGKFAGTFDNIIFCEAHPDSIIHAYNFFARKDFLFLRTNYMSLPFANSSVSNLICIDTLERGATHETYVLKEIKRVLNPGGIAVVDFHCRSFKETSIFHYSKDQIVKFLRDTGFGNFKIKKIGYYPTALPFFDSFLIYKIVDFTLGFFFKPMRYLVYIKNE